jgi:hypothetical protein
LPKKIRVVHLRRKSCADFFVRKKHNYLIFNFLKKKTYHTMRLLLLYPTLLLLVVGCKNDPSATTASATPPVGCILEKGGYQMIKIGQPVPKDLPRVNEHTGEGTFVTYQLKTKGGIIAKVYPMQKEGDSTQIVHQIYYMNEECKTDRGIGVGSTVADLRKAYPDVVVRGSETEGRTHASTSDGWLFLLKHIDFSADTLPLDGLNQATEIKAVIMR